MQNKESECHVIMITSANPGSGKTFISFNLATSLGIKGKRIIAIDLDLRKGSLSQYAGSPKKGISDYLAGDVKNIKDVIVKPSEDSKIDLIPVGTVPPNPTELLFSERLEQLMAGLRKEYDYIFIDCPPVEIVADAAIISKLADMTLFIVRAGLLDQSMLPEIEKFYTDKNTGTCRLSSMERTVEADVTGINMDISTATTTGMPAIQKRNNQKMWPFTKRTSLADSGIFRGFTDWHCHLLPSVDDGVQTMEESCKSSPL